MPAIINPPINTLSAVPTLRRVEIFPSCTGTGIGDGDGDADGDGEVDGAGEGDAEGDGDAEGEGDADGEGDGDAEGEGDGVGIEVTVIVRLVDGPWPCVFVALIVTLNVPTIVGVPEIRPVVALSFKPAGSVVALKLVGLFEAVI